MTLTNNELLIIGGVALIVWIVCEIANAPTIDDFD